MSSRARFFVIGLSLALGALSACSQSVAPPAPPPADAPAPAAVPVETPEAIAARAALEAAEAQRLRLAARPFQKNGRVGVIRLDASGAPMAQGAAERAAWVALRAELEPRLGALIDTAPLSVRLSGEPTRDRTALLRRAGALQGLDYVLAYEIRSTISQAPRAIFVAPRWRGEAAAEAVLIDVASGGIVGTAQAEAAIDSRTLAAPELGAPPLEVRTRTALDAAAVSALGVDLDRLARRLETEAMRAPARTSVFP